jgi:hypothetical protein
MLSGMQQSSNTKITPVNICLIIVFMAIVSVTVVIRIRTLAVPLERDEGEYAYAGQLMLQGVPPYSLAYNMKMPGIYAAYAIILACFGQTQSGIHAGVMVINTATVLLLFLLVKKLFGSVAGIAAAAFFAITSICNAVVATANAENFVVFFAIPGIILLLMFAESKKIISLITGGLFLGIAFIMKQYGAGFILFGFLFLLWSQISRKPVNWLSLISIIIVYSFAVTLPYLLTCLLLWHCGVFEKFWFWTFEYARQYVSIIPFQLGFMQLKENLSNIILSSQFIWLSALLGLLSIIWNNKIRKQSIFLVCFLICSFLCVCPGFFFRNHYFVLFLPALAVLAAAGVVAINDLLEIYIKSKPITVLISILVVLVIWFQSFYVQRNYLLESDPVIISKYNFSVSPFPDALQIADFIKSHSGKDDKIAILGSEPEIFFYSQRRSVTPYIYAYPLMEPQPYALDMQREMISQIEANKPKYIIFVNIYHSWIIWSDSKRLIFEWVVPYVKSYYRQVGLVDGFYEEKTLYHWDSVTKPLKPDGWIYIGERID